jgi:ATP adenylyltransferase
MDHIWSPWRYRYVTTSSPDDRCVFCAKLTAGDDEGNYIIHRGAHNFVLLNLFPYTNGHMMVAPYAHVADYDDLPDEAAHEMTMLTQQAVRHLKALYKPHGINVGMNLGQCAGAGIAGHLHMHILPRWYGDVSFMTSIGETRVLPEELSVTWRKLRGAFAGGVEARSPAASEGG